MTEDSRSENGSSGNNVAGGRLQDSQAVSLAELVSYAEGAVVSRTLMANDAGTLTLFAFDVGQALSEHSAPFDAIVQVLDGRLELTIGGQSVTAGAGQMVVMPANVPHAVRADQQAKVLLTMMKAASPR